MQHSRRRGRLLAGALAIGAILTGTLAGSAQASGVPVGRPAATSQAGRVMASGSRSPHMIYPSRFVRVRVAGRNGASSVENIPIYVVTSGGFLKGIHACRALGNDESTQAVMCADIFADPDNNHGVEVAAGVEGICQNLVNRNDFPRCANIAMTFGIHSAAINFGDSTFDECGHNGELCDIPREIFEGPNFDLPATPGGGCDTTVGGPNEVWTVIQSGSSIELPISADTRDLAANLGSQHAIVCGV